MAFITYLVDIQGPTGVSLIAPNPDGTRPPLVLQLGTGFTLSYAAVGAQGIVTVLPPAVPPNTSVSVTAPLTSTLTGSNYALAISAATDSTAGSMSGTDKTKLDAIVSGAGHARIQYPTTPVHRWAFDEAAGSSSFADSGSSGSPITLTTLGSGHLTSGSAGMFGSSLNTCPTTPGNTTSPTGGCVTGGAAAAAIQGPVTIACWIAPLSTLQTGGIFGRSGDAGNAGTNDTVGFRWNGSAFQFKVYLTTAGATNLTASSYNLAYGPSWYFLVGTWTGTVATFYINGDIVAQTTVSADTLVNVTANPYYVGAAKASADTYSTGQGFAGKIDDCVIDTSAAWTQAQVTTAYQAALTRY